MINIFKKKSSEPLNGSFEMVKQLVIKILGDNAGQFILTPDTKFEEIGFDSIKFISLLLHLEDLTDVDIETIALEINLSSIQTLAEIAQLLDKLNNNQAS